MKALEANPNPFNGIVITPEALPTADLFQSQLRDSLAVWARDGFKVVWLEIPMAKSRLIPIAVEAGFRFHHSSENYLLLTYRLMKEALIPSYATHYLGVGGVVLNERQELLVVSERYRRNRTSPSYKLPGGALHQGEHLVDAVIREVYEETGVRAQFENLVCFRHWHGYRYGKSDIYFICRLSPLSQEISMQEDEIEACLWMPVTEYLASDHVALFNKKVVQAALETSSLVPISIEGYTNPATHEFFMPKEVSP